MVSYIYSFTKRMAFKLGRVMTYSEGYMTVESCGHMNSREVVLHIVDVISTFYLHRRHMAPIYGRMVILLGIFKKYQNKK